MGMGGGVARLPREKTTGAMQGPCPWGCRRHHAAERGRGALCSWHSQACHRIVTACLRSRAGALTAH